MLNDFGKPTRTMFRDTRGEESSTSRGDPGPVIQRVLTNRAAEIPQVIAAGYDVNYRDDDGMTALHHAAASGARPCIRALVASGKCDYLIRDNEGRYASDLAIEWARDFAVARLLTKHQLRQAGERGVPAWVPPGQS